MRLVSCYAWYPFQHRCSAEIDFYLVSLYIINKHSTIVFLSLKQDPGNLKFTTSRFDFYQPTTSRFACHCYIWFAGCVEPEWSGWKELSFFLNLLLAARVTATDHSNKTHFISDFLKSAKVNPTANPVDIKLHDHTLLVIIRVKWPSIGFSFFFPNRLVFVERHTGCIYSFVCRCEIEAVLDNSETSKLSISKD